MNCKSLAVVVVTIFIGIFVTVSNVSAEEMYLPSMQSNGCGVSDGISVYFNDPVDPGSGTYIRTDKGFNKASIGPLDIDLPAGFYQVVLTSYDKHSRDNASEIPQELEEWFVRFEYDNGETADSGIISDLPEDQDWLRDQIVNDSLHLSRRVVKITAIHAHQGAPNYQSVFPVCIGLKAVTASIGDFVWHDLNRNGLQDRNEPGIANVDVYLFAEGVAEPVGYQKTDGNGRYHFTNLTPGNYQIQVVPPAEYFITLQNSGDDNFDSDIDGNGFTEMTNLAPNENDLSWDAGLYRDNPVTIKALVFCDSNSNGVQDGNEPGKENITVQLMLEGNEVQNRLTDATGWAFFSEMNEAQYTVQIVVPANHQLVRTFTIMPVNGGSNDETYVFPIIGPDCVAGIGDYVWLDKNANGLQDGNETGLGDVTVILKDEANNEVARTATNGNGYYQFTNLIPAKYSLQFEIPSGYQISPANVGNNDLIDSDIDGNGRTSLTQLEIGELDLTWDAGLYQEIITACGRFNLDLGRSAQTGAGVAGRYEMIEVGTGKLLATWDADFWWADSGWIYGIELSNADGSWVEVFFYPHGNPPAQKLEVINPAPGTNFGWLAPGICHAVEIEFPIDWVPPTSSDTVEVTTTDETENAEEAVEPAVEANSISASETVEIAESDNLLNVEANRKPKLSQNREKYQIAKWLEALNFVNWLNG